MVRGHAKEVAQQRNAAKLAEKAKSAKRDSSEVSCTKTFIYGSLSNSCAIYLE